MNRIITEPAARPMKSRVLWFIALYAAGVLVTMAVAGVLKAVLM